MSAPNCTVLIVDDDEDTREALATALADAGFTVQIACNALEGLQMMRESSEPDVVLLDLRMPGVDGQQFLEQTRQSRSRVIVLTGDSSARLLRFARDAKLMEKPVDLDELEAAVKEACAA